MSNSLVGKRLGKYEIRALLGQGGMATVYVAYQADIDREVAIKVLPPHPGQDPQFMERFQQEARTIARLQHPHILPVFDYGVENEILYLVMPYIGGGSLKELMMELRLPPARIVAIINAIASAIDYAHRQGVIHRDIKPDNILLDKEGNPSLTDFGIAKLLESNLQFTASGGFLGTPAYMAPEQGRGIKDIDGRADIYALGVLAFEMLTGNHPYSAETPMMVMFKHVSDPVPSLKEVTDAYPLAVDAVLQRALAKNREDRYQTASEFSRALEAALSGQTENPTSISVPTASGRAVPESDVQTYILPAETVADAVTPVIQTAPSRRQGSGMLIGGIAFLLLAVGAVVLFLVLGGDGDEEGENQTTAETQAPTAAAASSNFGIVQFRTTNSLGDTVVLNVKELTPPTEGQLYRGWLYNQQEQRWLAIGTVPVDVFGEGTITFTSPEGESLYTDFDAVAISLETPDSTLESPTTIAYSGVLSAEVIHAMQQLLVAWTDAERNPEALSLVDIATAEFEVANDHAGRALSGAERGAGPNVRTHGEHVYNILNGTTEDVNNDGSSGTNPSNLKIGLLTALTEIDNLLLAAQNAAGITSEQQAQLVTVLTCAENALFPLEGLIEQARTFANVRDADVASILSDIQVWTQALAPLGAGIDADGDNAIEPVEGECGIQGIREFALFMNTITLSEGSVFAEGN